MAILQLSGGTSFVAADSSAATGAPARPAGPGAAERPAVVPALAGGQVASAPTDADAANGVDEPAALTPKTVASSAHVGADDSSPPIGTQLVLVFDDQTHSMAVKMLDIVTQKVEQTPPSAKAPPGARSASLGQGGSGLLIDTKA